jgi:hypothetical protein
VSLSYISIRGVQPINSAIILILIILTGFGSKDLGFDEIQKFTQLRQLTKFTFIECDFSKKNFHWLKKLISSLLFLNTALDIQISS